MFFGVGVGHVFWCYFVFFCFLFWRFVPETVWKIFLDVRSYVFGFVLSSLGFFRRRRFCFFVFLFQETKLR